MLYAMMALVNLSYCNERVQELVRACGGIPLIQQQLSSPLYEARKTAAFCLGNLVRDSSVNAKELGLNGGVEALLRCLNDEDDDELSGSNDVRVAAAELLLALISCEEDASPRQRVLEAGGKRALEAIASASWSGDVLSARAKQAIRELS